MPGSLGPGEGFGGGGGAGGAQKDIFYIYIDRQIDR